MSEIPQHILAQIPALAAEGMPAEQIAFMLRLSPTVVEAELAKVTTTSHPHRIQLLRELGTAIAIHGGAGTRPGAGRPPRSTAVRKEPPTRDRLSALLRGGSGNAKDILKTLGFKVRDYTKRNNERRK